jgi:hypothetical protein
MTSKFTERHFVALARILQDIRLEVVGNAYFGEESLDLLECHLIEYFEDDNPRFKADKFRQTSRPEEWREAA